MYKGHGNVMNDISMTVEAVYERAKQTLGDDYIVGIIGDKIRFAHKKHCARSTSIKTLHRKITQIRFSSVVVSFTIGNLYTNKANKVNIIKQKSKGMATKFGLEVVDYEDGSLLCVSVELIICGNKKDMGTYKISNKSTNESLDIYLQLVLLDNL
jgi:hypothetical protein